MKNGNEQMTLEEIDIIKDKNGLILDMSKQIEELKKNIELVREDAQLEIMRRDQRISELEKLEKEHQDLNGKLRVEINRYKEGHDI